ncbi:SDR family NAD(P)-dependent oxidoreductase [Sphingopyxis alaskensis]|jgi:NAD(P)-dependent dehydrogenase (short-subunit alcohol dehydrogenase family)|nr:SDR family NAD(P)-dependent oxidoreductase [Sphingopyxis alaskensis]MCM3419588.1 SDR family NAD(P)-dependent oxidoreductase [Sphingopyxis alaskensis]
MTDPESAVVIGAAGGIGAALADALAADGRHDVIHRLARSAPAPFAIDITDADSVAAAAAMVAAGGPPPRLVIVATGLLHADGHRPERGLSDIDPDWMARSFAVNTIGPALVARHFLPLLPRRGRTIFTALSARVGSIADNRTGGWFSYRASKAALNQLVRSFAIAETRRNPEAVVVALHPGTVDTAMSRPFQRAVAPGTLVTPPIAAANLLRTIDALTPAQTGRIFAWDGSEIIP